MLASMAVTRTDKLIVRPLSTGHAIAARRKWLGLTAEEVVERTDGAINLKLLSQLENNRYDPADLKLGKYKALLDVLKWTPGEFEEATGVPPMAPEPLPGAEAYNPSLRVPVVGTVSAGLAAIEEIVEADSFLYIDPHVVTSVRNAAPGSLVGLIVNGDSMVSDSAARTVPHNSHVVVELGAVPQNGDLVVAWLPNRDTLVLKMYQDDRNAVLKSFNPRGPVFRLGEEPIEVRGVVRLVQTILG